MGDHLGRFEHFLLLAVMRLGEDAYGMTIRRESADHTGRDIAVGADNPHPASARLERRGLVQSWLGEPTHRRGGKAKRHYRVLAAGKKALAKAEAALTALSRAAGDHPRRTRRPAWCPTPPCLARWLLRRLLAGPVRSAIVGDLDEEFSGVMVPRHGARAARRWGPAGDVVVPRRMPSRAVSPGHRSS